MTRTHALDLNRTRFLSHTTRITPNWISSSWWSVMKPSETCNNNSNHRRYHDAPVSSRSRHGTGSKDRRGTIVFESVSSNCTCQSRDSVAAPETSEGHKRFAKSKQHRLSFFTRWLYSKLLASQKQPVLR